MASWKGKVALVTGGSAGLGRAIAAAFASRGARVVLCARDPERLHAAAEELGRQGADIFAVPADVTRQEDVDLLVARALETFGRLDVLVNNVGRSMRGKILDISPEDFRDLLETNFLTAVRMTRAAAPHLAATRGHIVNIGSLAAKTTGRYLGAYPASKFPLAAYSQQLRLELATEGVHVLLVCPGPVARDDADSRYAEQSAELPESARRPGGGARVKAIDPEDLAHRIVRACERRRAELIVPGKARLLFALSQVSPAWGDWLLRRMTKEDG